VGAKPAPSDPYAEDLTLVERCLSGDRSAWVALIDRYRRLIYSIPVRLGLATEQADEVFQDVCLRLLDRLETLRDGRSLARWLIVTTQRRCWDLAAHERRYVEEPADRPAVAADDDPEALVLASERAHLVRRAFERLTETCRELLHDLFYRDPPLSYAELARSRGRSIGSLGPTRARCLGALRTRLEELGFQ